MIIKAKTYNIGYIVCRKETLIAAWAVLVAF